MGNSSTSAFVDEDLELEHRVNRTELILVPPLKNKQFVPNDNVLGQSWKDLDVMAKGLGLTAVEVNMLYSMFGLADVDGGGTIDLEEFYDFLKIDRTPFWDRLFFAFGRRIEGEVTFIEFVVSIWNFCTWKTKQLPSLLFNLYDDDKSGYLDSEEAKLMIKEMFAARTVQDGTNIMIESLKRIAVLDPWGRKYRVYRKAFLRWCKRQKVVWRSVLLTQRMIQKKIFGEDWWESAGDENREEVIDLLKQIKETDFEEPEEKKATLWADIVKQQKEEERENERLAQLPPEVRAARKRMNAYHKFRKKQLKTFKKWHEAEKKYMAEKDPLSLMLELEEPMFLKELKQRRKGEMAERELELRSEMYHAPPRKYESNREVYFQTKFVSELHDLLKPEHAPNRLSVTGKAIKHRYYNRNGRLVLHFQKSPKSRGKKASKSAAKLRDEVNAHRQAASKRPSTAPAATFSSRRGWVGASPLRSSRPQTAYKGKRSADFDLRGQTIGFKGKYTMQNHKVVPEKWKKFSKREMRQRLRKERKRKERFLRKNKIKRGTLPDA